jgi:16S rRNA (cytosine967-C5)-methyltransferase
MVSVQLQAAQVVAAVLEGRSLTAVLEQTLARSPRLGPGERGAMRDIASGTLRYLGLMRELQGRLMHRRPDDPRIESLLSCALYQLEYTRVAQYAVVDQAVEAVAAAGLPRAKGLVNAVLRRFLRERDALLLVARGTQLGRYNHPDWWVERLRSDHPNDWESILAAGNERPLMTLRVNSRHASRDDYMERLLHADMPGRPIGLCGIVLERPVPVERLPGFAAGHVSVQDYGAQLAAELLQSASGTRVLDACAAPGGKAAHILELADVELVALDSDALRARRVQENLDRLGLAAHVHVADATAPTTWWDGHPFDRILVDAPCSASGVVRRHPDAKWLRRPSDVVGLARQQDALLDALWPLLASGGRMLYATCSMFNEENRARLDRLLGKHADARFVPIGEQGAPDLQMLPGASHDGFYYGLLERL